MGLQAPQPVQAGVDNDPVQPAAHRGVVPEGAGAAVRREHRVLQRVLGVLGGAGGEPGEPVQMPLVAAEQFREGVPVSGDVGGEQFGVTAIWRAGCPVNHGRTVTNRRGAGHFTGGRPVSAVRTRPGP